MWHLRNLPEQSNALLPDDESHVASFLANADWHVFPNVIPRVVVISDRQVHLFGTGKIISWRPKHLIASMPLAEPIAATRGKLGYKLELGGESLTVPFIHTSSLNEASDASRQHQLLRS